jgi:hypothetical protein
MWRIPAPDKESILLNMMEVYGRQRGAVNNHEKPQRSALEERVGTRKPAATNVSFTILYF